MTAKVTIQQIILMVGIPGSGKTRYVLNAARMAEELGLRIGVVSADFFFELGSGYHFHLDMLGLAHMTAQARAKMMLREGFDLVFVDNTNLTAAERAPWLELAMIFGADVRAEVMLCDVDAAFDRQRHGVPYARLIAMANSLDLFGGQHLLQAGAGRQVPVEVA